MSHSFDFQSISDKLFLLRNLAAGSKTYCKVQGTEKGSHPYGDDEWGAYAFQLRRVISSYLIECAAKTRIFEDTIKGKVKPTEFKEADTYAQQDCSIGTVLKGSFNLTVRESCNKIIHATSVELAVANSTVRRPYQKYTYWTGQYHLLGSHNRSAWEVALDIPKWCVALDFYLEHLGELVDWDDLPYD
jgi:hypothetical protein